MKKFFIICYLFFGQMACAGQNLEEYCQDFAVDFRKVEVPGFPFAFNPSIVHWNGKLLLSFREIKNPNNVATLSSCGDSSIGLVWLDEDFRPIDKPQILSLKSKNMEEMQSEDARLVTVGDRLYLVYSGNSNRIIDDEGFRMYVCELSYDGTSFSIIHNECLSQFDGRNKNKREKNWVPFSFGNELYLAYSLKPHKIFKPYLDGSNACQTMYSTTPSIVWEWGELRGGTPALPIDEHSYLSFFHSSRTMATEHSQFLDVPHYFMGAYLFSQTPPFNITQISPEPIVSKGFYSGQSYEPYWHPVQVVFPCGFTFNEKFIWIALGRQDHEMWIVKLDKKEFLNCFIQVSTLKGSK